ncbi:MAG: hypothetical protein K6C99_02920 [Lachnospiraceae bacterium]|nr:hypothetical protein [Lachnospiraceae bacterium]
MNDEKEKSLEKKPMSRSRIERRMLSREEIEKWNAETAAVTAIYKHYWETEEKLTVTEPGDEYLIFVGKYNELTAKVWNILDRESIHSAFILRITDSEKYDFSEKEGLLLRFLFRGSVRIFNKSGLVTFLEGDDITVYQKNDDIIVKIEEQKGKNIFNKYK